MELIKDTKTVPYAQSESSSETHPSNVNNAKTKSLSLLVHHQPMLVSYKECLKNHAATLGGHALDGCGEFMPTDPASFKCVACGCHRNFHRRDGPAFLPNPPSSSPSPPSPVPYSYYSSAPHMLLTLSSTDKNTSGRKRSRTKFSKEQKEKMHAFAEKAGWRMPRGEERLVKELCNEVGVDRGVLKVWMHNNKNTFGKKEMLADSSNNNKNSTSGGNNEDDNGNGNAGNSFGSNSDTHNNNEYCIQLHVTNNGSSSAS
ncbi:hypothetical protein HRI_002407900 [Hibiscus trionum]|uniref:ZF-HD dimerization-type domain-containing protein n=1 Tax=Hibiscus trionum TaxID=183268 RepID=A0A9W7I2I5_HIBTR|nr:hypothetical protein HRI_002407900 [Hibiscus trionum]